MMIEFKEHCGTQRVIVADGDELGYVDSAKGADVALIIQRDNLPDALLGKLVRALDERDGGPYPERNLCMLGRYALAKDFVDYATG